jgi:hypothetical protein
MGPRVTDLQLRFDNSVPPDLLRAARALDDVEARRRQANKPKSAGKPGKVTLKPAGIVAVMANDMLDIRATRGAVEQKDLIARGWTIGECVAYGEQAASIAAERSGMRHALMTEA